jgi:hypothetical protein
VEVEGLVDVLTEDTLWEVKCVGSLVDEHYLQLAVYAWLWKKTKEVNIPVFLTSTPHVF